MTEAVVPRRCGAGAASRGGTGRPDSSPSEVRSARLLDGAAGGAGAPLRGIHQYDEIRNQFQKRNESCGKTVRGMKTDPPTVPSRLR